MSVLALDDAKAHLNITGTTSDDEVQAFIDAAEARLSGEVGALDLVPRSERVPGCSDVLVLASLPVAALTSVTPTDGDALDVSDLYLDRDAGVVTYRDGSSFGARLYTVVYTPGLLDPGANIVQAVKELVRHMWKTQRGQMRVDPEADPSATFALPRRVLELIDRDTARQSGFA